MVGDWPRPALTSAHRERGVHAYGFRSLDIRSRHPTILSDASAAWRSLFRVALGALPFSCT